MGRESVKSSMYDGLDVGPVYYRDIIVQQHYMGRRSSN